MLRRVGRIVALASVVALAGALQAAPLAAASELGQDKFKAGEKAPDFAAKDLNGGDVKLSSFAGKAVVLLNFWGLRCGACLEEMPYLEDLAKRYRDKGVAVLGVDTDGVGAEEVKATLKELGMTVTYTIVLDPDFTVTDAYTNFLVPLTLVIDKSGVIQYIHTGFEKGREKEYEAALKKALGS